MGRAALLLSVLLTACGRFGFGDAPPQDAGPSDTIIVTSDVSTSATCAEIGGRVCLASEICTKATINTADVATCCPANRCLALGTKFVKTATTTTGITIDGVLTDWAGITATQLTRKTIGTSAANDFTAQYSVTWDATGFYVLFQMTDDVCRPQDNVPPRNTAYNDDVVEVYFDMEPINNTTSTYRPEEQWTWVPQNCGASMAICGLAPPSAPLTTQLASWVRPPPNNNSVPGTNLIATYTRDSMTNCNWWVEVAVTWPAGYPTPVAGDVIGFDVAANDDDTGVRKNQLFWNDTSGTLSMDARRFGLLQLLP